MLVDQHTPFGDRSEPSQFVYSVQQVFIRNVLCQRTQTNSDIFIYYCDYRVNVHLRHCAIYVSTFSKLCCTVTTCFYGGNILLLLLWFFGAFGKAHNGTLRVKPRICIMIFVSGTSLSKQRQTNATLVNELSIINHSRVEPAIVTRNELYSKPTQTLFNSTKNRPGAFP